MLYRLAIYLFLLFLFVVYWTQIFVPAFKRQPLFPVFRKSTKKLVDATERLEEEKVNVEAKNVEEEIRKLLDLPVGKKEGK